MSVHVSIPSTYRTSLMLACTKDNREMVEILVGYGASLALKNKDGWNSFHIACREGHPDIVQFLLDTDSGCWETVSKNGRTPLHSAGEREREGEREGGREGGRERERNI